MAEELAVKMKLPSDMITDVGRELADLDAREVDVPAERPTGLEPISLTIAAVIGIHAISELILRWKAKRGCQQIIDARQDEIKTEMNCKVKDGRIIVVSRSGEKVEIVEAPQGIDLTEVLKAAASGGAAEVKKAADAAGAKTG
jgi:hypothetical protein